MRKIHRFTRDSLRRHAWLCDHNKMTACFGPYYENDTENDFFIYFYNKKLSHFRGCARG